MSLDKETSFETEIKGEPDSSPGYAASHSQLSRLAASLFCAPPKENPDTPAKTFTSGRIKKADYDSASRRPCSAPNPAAYWED